MTTETSEAPGATGAPNSSTTNVQGANMKTVPPSSSSFTFTTTKPSILEVDACERYADYKIVWRNLVKKVTTELVEDRPFRFSSRIEICDEAREIRVYLRKKSTRLDAQVLEWELELMTGGRMHQYPWDDGVSILDGAACRWLKLGADAEYYVSTCADARRWSDRIHACAVPGCLKFGKPEMLVRDEDDEEWIADHYGESIRHDAYFLELQKETGKGWDIYADISQPLDAFTAKSLTNDIAWLTAEAEKLNRAAEAAEGGVAA